MTYKVPVVEREDYTIYFQDLNGETWVHCDVRHWSPTAAKSIKRDADALKKIVGGPVYALNEPKGCKKHIKFLKMLGFRFLGELSSNAGIQYVYTR
jgi:hypothetical protein